MEKFDGFDVIDSLLKFEDQPMLANFMFLIKAPASSKNHRHPSIPPGNPYRAILRRDYPEPLIALLAFILGIWLWDHYFGKIAGLCAWH